MDNKKDDIEIEKSNKKDINWINVVGICIIIFCIIYSGICIYQIMNR